MISKEAFSEGNFPPGTELDTLLEIIREGGNETSIFKLSFRELFRGIVFWLDKNRNHPDFLSLFVVHPENEVMGLPEVPIRRCGKCREWKEGSDKFFIDLGGRYRCWKHYKIIGYQDKYYYDSLEWVIHSLVTADFTKIKDFKERTIAFYYKPHQIAEVIKEWIKYVGDRTEIIDNLIFCYLRCRGVDYSSHRKSEMPSCNCRQCRFKKPDNCRRGFDFCAREYPDFQFGLTQLFTLEDSWASWMLWEKKKEPQKPE